LIDAFIVQKGKSLIGCWQQLGADASCRQAF
jgi:hypothetical protein